jgi:hypothetical protein
VAAGMLPASGKRVQLRGATGEDELVVFESNQPAAVTILELANRLASDRAEPIDWPELPAVDLAAAALLIRSAWLGNMIHAEALCPAAGCEEPIEVAVSIPDYLDHHRPRPFRGLSECEPGWFALSGTEVRFRIPTIADLLGAIEDHGSETRMRERCLRPPDPSTALARRIDRALNALAPRLDGALSGTCPECGAVVELRFEPIGYILEELRDASSELFGQVHELAVAYHWSESAILGLSRRRRHAYVSLVREELALA